MSSAPFSLVANGSLSAELQMGGVGRALVFSPPVTVGNDNLQFMREVIERVFGARVDTRTVETVPGMVLVGDGKDYWFTPMFAKCGDSSWTGALISDKVVSIARLPRSTTGLGWLRESISE